MFGEWTISKNIFEENNLFFSSVKKSQTTWSSESHPHQNAQQTSNSIDGLWFWNSILKRNWNASRFFFKSNNRWYKCN
jgi:hypothetical protein